MAISLFSINTADLDIYSVDIYSTSIKPFAVCMVPKKRYLSQNNYDGPADAGSRADESQVWGFSIQPQLHQSRCRVPCGTKWVPCVQLVVLSSKRHCLIPLIWTNVHMLCLLIIFLCFPIYITPLSYLESRVRVLCATVFRTVSFILCSLPYWGQSIYGFRFPVIFECRLRSMWALIYVL